MSKSTNDTLCLQANGDPLPSQVFVILCMSNIHLLN